MSPHSYFRTRKLSHKLDEFIRVMTPTLVALSFAGVAPRPTGCMDFRNSPVLARPRALKQSAKARGYKVEGFAPTSRAAGQLREAGIQANTLTELPPSPDRQYARSAPPSHVG